MNDLQLGKMYLVKDWFRLLYPTKELATTATTAEGALGSQARPRAYRNARWYSEEYNCNVAVVEENTCVLLLEQDKNLFKVLDSNGNIGWIYCYDFSKCFELVKE